MDAGDIVRYAVYAFNAINIGMIGAVIGLHANAFWKAPRGYGLVPAHVVAVSIAQILFMILGSAGVLHQISDHDNPFGWRTAVFVAGSTITLGALLIIGEFERRRVK
jgi:hypothetical protein